MAKHSSMGTKWHQGSKVELIQVYNIYMEKHKEDNGCVQIRGF